jgi:hypothetical protein
MTASTVAASPLLEVEGRDQPDAEYVELERV